MYKATMDFNLRMSQQYRQSTQKNGGRNVKQQQQKEQDEFILLVSRALFPSIGFEQS